MMVFHEMTLDQEHVGRKFRAAAAREGRPVSDIQPLIDACQWAELAETLVKDRVLAEQFFASPVNDKTRRKLLQQIDRVQRRYFDSVISTSRFVISPRAGGLSAKAAKRENGSSIAGALPRYSDLIDEDEDDNDNDEDYDRDSDGEARKEK
jgi:hypothetical protein